MLEQRIIPDKANTKRCVDHEAQSRQCTTKAKKSIKIIISDLVPSTSMVSAKEGNNKPLIT